MTVTIPGDFDLQKIAASGQAFRIAQTPQGWRFLAGDKLLYLQPGSGDTYARVFELFFLDILGFSGFLLLSYPVCGP